MNKIKTRSTFEISIWVSVPLVILIGYGALVKISFPAEIYMMALVGNTLFYQAKSSGAMRAYYVVSALLAIGCVGMTINYLVKVGLL